MLIKLSSSENNRRVGRTFVMDTNDCSTTEGQLITLLYDNAFIIIIRYCIKLNQICEKVILQTQRRSTVYLHSNNLCHQTCQSWAAKLYNLPAVNYHFFFSNRNWLLVWIFINKSIEFCRHNLVPNIQAYGLSVSYYQTTSMGNLISIQKSFSWCDWKVV